MVNINEIAMDINKNPLLKGVTLSGGDPFMQAKVLSNLLKKIDKRLSVITYTGFEYEYLIKNASDKNGYLDLLEMTDVLIDSKFEESLKTDELPYRGSSNQRAIDVKKSLESNTICLYNF